MFFQEKQQWMGKRKADAKAVKRTIKYLAIAPDSDVAQLIVQKAPSGVIRAISNAALNAREGDVSVPAKYLNLFQNHRAHINALAERRVPLVFKRELLVQRGGALPLLVPLLATVLGSLGGEFISRVLRKDE